MRSRWLAAPRAGSSMVSRRWPEVEAVGWQDYADRQAEDDDVPWREAEDLGVLAGVPGFRRDRDLSRRVEQPPARPWAPARLRGTARRARRRCGPDRSPPPRRSRTSRGPGGIRRARSASRLCPSQQGSICERRLKACPSRDHPFVCRPEPCRRCASRQEQSSLRRREPQTKQCWRLARHGKCGFLDVRMRSSGIRGSSKSAG